MYTKLCFVKYKQFYGKLGDTNNSGAPMAFKYFKNSTDSES